MNESIIHDVKKIFNEENAILTAEFTENEIHDAILQMELNKSPDSDGFLAEFFQKIWAIIKGDLMEMLNSFHKGELSLFCLNFGTIILLPKK
jgi:hypothetical protein